MTLLRRVRCLLTIAILIDFHGLAQPPAPLVRLAMIEVNAIHLEQYNQLLIEEIEASIAREHGVITLYAVAEKENPERITLFETYADTSDYKDHLTTPHFRKYKQATLRMVKYLDLVETEPIFHIRKQKLSSLPTKNLLVRLVKMQIKPTKVDQFKVLSRNVMQPGVKTEAGVLVMYAVMFKELPANAWTLEVYSDSAAYKKHLTSPHYLEYKVQSKNMINTQEIIDVAPILLGSKVQK